MDQIEERLAEETRKFDHLYNPSLTEYKDAQMACNSWKEKSANVGLQVDECTKLWRKIRYKFVGQKKAMRSSSGYAGGKKAEGELSADCRRDSAVCANTAAGDSDNSEPGFQSSAHLERLSGSDG
ncbi:unnamed protein product [Pleuronectes platessa]|uniref:MADF domain-containing protein n=1 Tax=Pleuronectes platessa TaxID=8262 RepID=A0A9N7TYN2_PLEPL|nr:unnamed protein product [Pleuronectes platessa]